MIPRQILGELQQYLQEFPAVAILGPRQTGKTTLAHQVAELSLVGAGRTPLYLDLEASGDLAQLGDPAAFFALHADRLVILDEVQRMPGLFSILRGVIDQRRRSGARSAQFLLLGVASIDLLSQSSESLAGRLAYVELAPFVVTELPADQALAPGPLWLRGGFPDATLARNDAASCAGACSSSRPIWSGTSHNSAPESRHKPCVISGPCSRTSRRRYSTRHVLLLPWGSAVKL